MIQSGDSQRKCSMCHIEKATTMFSPKRLKSGIMGWQSECKLCRSIREKERRTRPEVIKRTKILKRSAKYKKASNDYKKTERCKKNRQRRDSSRQAKDRINASRAKWRNKPGIASMLSLNESLRRMMRLPNYKSHLLEYMNLTSDEFIDHINMKIKDNPGMSWENYGYRNTGFKGGWDIDHIIPKSLYDHTNPVDIARCWNIENLAPLWHEDNLKKTNKIVPSECRKVPQEFWPLCWKGVIPDCGDSTTYTTSPTASPHM